MPTDILAAIERRAAQDRQEGAAVLLLPLAMCIVTAIAALESPAVTAGFRLFGMF
ncbi:MAG: hypothetical protein ACTHLO_05140 [Pseudolabrys sp.]